MTHARRITDRPRRRGFPLARRTVELVVFVAAVWWLLSMWVDAGGAR